jgi:Bacterial Ig-like domain/FlgD Ig-like domain
VNDTTPPAGGIQLLAPTTDASAVQVGWAATDVGSGVSSFSVQVRDRSVSTWMPWLTGTTATHAYFVGTAGHAYEFRVSATDFKGNAQPWQSASADPGATLAVGGFARVAVDSLNVRPGAGTGFGIVDALPAGSVIAVLGGPIDASGYSWYQVQFGFTEWPSAQYPRLGWVAAASGSTPYIVPTLTPAATRLSPAIGSYQVAPRQVSPDGDGINDSATVSVNLPLPASAARLDVIAANGAVVAGRDLGSLAAGLRQVTWDGRLSSGAWAGNGSYLLRLTASDANGTHLAPAAGVDPGVLAAWGVVVDLVPPSAAPGQVGANWSTTIKPSVTFSEPVAGVDGSTFALVDSASGTRVSGTVSYVASTRTATLAPGVLLVPGRTYAASLTTNIRDAAGNRLPATGWTFTTTALVTSYSPTRSVTFLAGTYAGRRFDSAGNVIASKTYTLTKSSSAPTSQRNAAIAGQSGAWLYITAGIWAGYWVKESPSDYLPGVAASEHFAPLRTASFAIGTYTGYRFDTAWSSVVATKTYSLARSSSASASSLAVINGRTYVLITNGIWAGYWIPMSSAIILL